MNKYISVDPEQSYHIDCPTTAEGHALEVLKLFPDATLTRTRDVIQIDIQGDRGCVLVVTAEAIEFRHPTTEWTCGAYGPRSSGKLSRRVLFNRSDYKKLPALIASTMMDRQSEFQKCVYCRKLFPPEHLTGDACHGCSSKTPIHCLLSRAPRSARNIHGYCFRKRPPSGGGLGFRALQSVKEVGRALRMGRRCKDGAFVILQDGQP
jgi:hypothetical protein